MKTLTTLLILGSLSAYSQIDNFSANATLRLRSPLGGQSTSPIQTFLPVPKTGVIVLTFSDLYSDLKQKFNTRDGQKVNAQLGKATKLILGIALCSSNSESEDRRAVCKGNVAKKLNSTFFEVFMHDVQASKEHSVLSEALDATGYSGWFAGMNDYKDQKDAMASYNNAKKASRFLAFNSSFLEQNFGMREIGCVESGKWCYINY